MSTRELDPGARRVLLVGVEPRWEAQFAGAEAIRMALDPTTLSAIDTAAPGAAMVSVPPGEARALALRIVSRLAKRGTRVVAMAPVRDVELVVEAMRAGAVDFVVPGEEQRIVRSLWGDDANDDARIVTTVPAKGGVGATMVATNLATLLASSGARTCLVDLDLPFGGVRPVLATPPGPGIAELIERLDRAGREEVDATLPRHRSGARLIAPGDRIEDAERIGPREVSGLLARLRLHFRYVVVDGLRGLSELSIAVLDASDALLLITTQEPAAVHNAALVARVLDRLGYEPDKIRLVVNRHAAHAEPGLSVVAETTRLAVRATLVDDMAAMSKAARRAEPVSACVGESLLGQGLCELAHSMQPEREPTIPIQTSLLSRLWPGRKRT